MNHFARGAVRHCFLVVGQFRGLWFSRVARSLLSRLPDGY
jgi:hypothetical protein